MKRWAVIGGGFRGIIGAHFLAKSGCQVTLVEGAPFLGGVLYSQEWNGLYLDNGCHLFDNVDDEVTEVMQEIMDGEIFPVHVKYASVTEGVKSDGLLVMDCTVLDRDTQAKILMEVVEAATTCHPKASTLAEAYNHRYGETLGERLSSAAAKIFCVGAAELDASASKSLPFGRVHIVPDDQALLLKESPALDERIAASSQDDPLKFYRHQVTKFPYRNFYPRGKGMRSFCEKAFAHLTDLGVTLDLGDTVESMPDTGTGIELKLKSGKRIEADRILWAMDAGALGQTMLGHNPLEGLVHRVPLMVYYYRCSPDQVGEYTYIHDYSKETIIFRASTPGTYGQQLDSAGLTYVCFEVPTELSSSRWSDPDSALAAVWGEAQKLGIVRGEQPREHTILRAPEAFGVGKLGFGEARDELIDQIRRLNQGVFIPDQTAFGKIDIVANLKDVASF